MSAFGSKLQLLFLTLLLQVIESSLEEIQSNEIRTFEAPELHIGKCKLVIFSTCPHPDVKFFLFTRKNPSVPQIIDIGEGILNLTSSNFNPEHKTKIIIHGYNSDRNLSVLEDIRRGYLEKAEHNIFAVDWSRLCPGPCYPTAVYNARFAGQCLAQIVQALRLQGARDFHIIGFSVGAHVAAFAANNLRPYKLPRITGLDPAMPLFVTSDKDHKLDASDAEFVDVIHTNAFMQGKIESSGNVDFYVNGAILQPGCWNESNPIGCDHHRAPAYFAESIISEKGFWGWPCSGYAWYLLGLCPPRYPTVIMGDKVPDKTRGFYLVKTASETPFALGPISVSPMDDLRPKQRHKEVVEELWTKSITLDYENANSITPHNKV